MSSNTAAVALAESYANLYATVGMHPHDAKQVNEPELRQKKGFLPIRKLSPWVRPV
jgi:Tat protein secretion system quality control protein TatD with DNase activity